MYRCGADGVRVGCDAQPVLSKVAKSIKAVSPRELLLGAEGAVAEATRRPQRPLLTVRRANPEVYVLRVRELQIGWRCPRTAVPFL